MEGRIGPAHDHSYRLQVRCRSRTLEQDDHIVIGYQVLRDPMKQVLQAYNNHLLNDLPPFRRLQPTTENLAAVLFQQLQRMLTDVPIELISVTLWESPTEAVTYRIDPKTINDPSVQSSNGEELRSVCVAPSSSQRG